MGSAWNEDLNVERLGYARGGETKNVGTATHDSHRFSRRQKYRLDVLAFLCFNDTSTVDGKYFVK